jgi:hypothetical protein
MVHCSRRLPHSYLVAVFGTAARRIVELLMSATPIMPPVSGRGTTLEQVQAFVEEQSKQTGQSKLLVLVAIHDMLRREQEQQADDLRRVAHVGLVRQLVVSELRRLWAERLIEQAQSVPAGGVAYNDPAIGQTGAATP